MMKGERAIPCKASLSLIYILVFNQFKRKFHLKSKELQEFSEKVILKERKKQYI